MPGLGSIPDRLAVCKEAQASLVPRSAVRPLPGTGCPREACRDARGGARLPSGSPSCGEPGGPVGPGAAGGAGGAAAGAPGRGACSDCKAQSREPLGARPSAARRPWEQPGWPGGGAGVGAPPDSPLGGGTPVSPAPTCAAFGPAQRGGAWGLQVGACGLNWPRARSPTSGLHFPFSPHTPRPSAEQRGPRRGGCRVLPAQPGACL